MIYCPKYGTWIFREECDYSEDCWELEAWDSCVILRKKMSQGEKELRKYLDSTKKS